MMQRGLINIAAALSLLLCVAIVVLAVRSYWRWDEFSWGIPVGDQADSVRTLSASSGRGGLMLAASFRSFDPPSGPTVTNYWDGWVHTSDRPRSPTAPPGGGTIDYSRQVLGFGARRWRGTARSVWTSDERITIMAITQTGLFVPHWFLALALALLPALKIRRAIRLRRVRHRRERGLCSACGYDLRGTPERCPECGAVAVR